MFRHERDSLAGIYVNTVSDVSMSLINMLSVHCFNLYQEFVRSNRGLNGKAHSRHERDARAPQSVAAQAVLGLKSASPRSSSGGGGVKFVLEERLRFQRGNLRLLDLSSPNDPIE
jgi:hypothetical protein